MLMASRKKSNKKKSRRNFIQSGLKCGAGALFFSTAATSCKNPKEKVKALTQDGQLVEIDRTEAECSKPATPEEARQGIPNRKFVMVIDLSRCRNARKCVEKCQEAHHLLPGQEFIRVYLLQRSEKSAPYWFPKPCYHCNNPLCASVCPVGATYKRSDGIVLVDNERCIGCKFCMTGCPYNARIFIWEKLERQDEEEIEYSPETSIPVREGTVAKCDFCPDMIRKKELPHCVTACPMGVIYFGDINEDSVTNGTETVSFSELIKENDGYRYLEVLGTDPSVYYLPANARLFPFERGLDGLDDEILERYKNTPYFKNNRNG
jgi:molybdopterin-containing oxidoreductase family iron-sulfur binding subunit